MLSACGLSASSDAGLSEGPEVSSGAAVTQACASIDLRTPSGDGLDLTGTWSGDGALFFVAQDGDCVHWEELSGTEGGPLGERFRRVFSGTLREDFTVSGTFGMIYVQPGWIVPAPGYDVPRSGEAVYEVVFDEEGAPTLEGPARESVDYGAFETVVLTRISTSTAIPPSTAP
jgi:hypothetical protein